MANALARATSPYLLQHKDNPVAWREWSDETLALAKERDRPILLSVGYAACHWCHVMAHESFEKPEIAALMNELFVNIKVDREERPDLDTIYQQALALMGQQGGWPLTMFLTPEGEPFWGGTYFPPEQRYGRPGLPQVLEHVARLWREERDKVDGNRTQLAQALQRLARPDPGAPVGPELALDAARAIGEQIDAVHGGIGGAPKFPQAPVLDLLWRAALLTDDEVLTRRLLHTMRRMAQGGIYDHLGGGFARYSVDAFWLVPHFEKMLYDNAQLLRLLGLAWAASGDTLFAERARETVGWLMREMRTAGAFAASLDADSEGEEGKYYVWSAEEIDRLLGADAPAFRLAYGITAHGNFEGHNIPNRLHEAGQPPADQRALLARCRATLLQARALRVPPARDDKLLADWNGLVIRGLAEAGLSFGEPAWIETAASAFRAVVEHMSEGDRLRHSWREGQALPMAFLDDYAQLARAAVALFEATGEPAWLERADAWLDVCDRDFRDADGGYFLTAGGGDRLIVRPKNAHDGPSPAANGTLAETGAALWHLTGEDRHRQRAEAIVAAFSGEARRNPFGHATLLGATLLLADAVQIVLVGPADAPGMAELAQTATGAALPTRLLMRVADAGGLKEGHPAAGKGMVDGRPTAYVCVGATCLPPATDPATLRARLAETRGRARA